MRTWLLILLVADLSSGESSKLNRPTGFSANECPPTLAGYQYARDRLILKTIEPLKNGETFAVETGEKYIDKLLTCTDTDKNMKPHEKQLKACLARTKEFLRELSLRMPRPDFSNGLTVEDSKYLELSDQYTTIPTDLIDSGFFTEVATHGLTDKALSQISTLNQKRTDQKIEILPYRSELGTTGEASLKTKVLIFYPDPQNKRDVWIQIPRKMNENQKDSSHTFVYVLKTDEKKAYFRAFEKKMEGDTTKVAKFHTHIENGIDGSCFECHLANKPVPIPEKGVLAKDLPLRDKLEQKIVDYGKVAGPYRHISKTMPSLGASIFKESDLAVPCGSSDTRSKAEQTSKEKNPSELYKKIRSHMNCASCHKIGGEVDPIQPPLALALEMAIESGHMPPGAILNSSEQRLLLECLSDEYFGKRSEEPGKEREFTQAGVLEKHLTLEPCVGENEPHVQEQPQPPPQHGK